MNKKQLSNLSKFKNADLPILEMVLIDSDTCTVTDLEVSYRCQHALPIEDPVIVPIENFVKIIRKYDVHAIEKENHKAIIKTDDGVFKLACEDINDFPEIPDVGTLSGFEITRQTVDKFSGYTSTDDLRPALCGIFCGEKHLVATDGCLMRWEEHGQDIENPFIIPNNPIRFLTEEKYTHYTSEDAHSLVGTSETITYQPVNEQYVNWQAVIPGKEKRVQTNLLDFSKTIKTIDAGCIVNSETNKIMLQAKDKQLFLYACDIDMETEYKSEAIGTYKTNSDPFDIALNGQLLKKVLQDAKKQKKTKLMNSHPGSIKMELSGKNMAAVIENQLMIMPIMQNSYS